MYSKKVDRYDRRVDTEKQEGEKLNVHEKQFNQVHRRIQKNHCVLVLKRQDLFPDSDRIRRVLISNLQLGAEILSGSNRR